MVIKVITWLYVENWKSYWEKNETDGTTYPNRKYNEFIISIKKKTYLISYFIQVFLFLTVTRVLLLATELH